MRSIIKFSLFIILILFLFDMLTGFRMGLLRIFSELGMDVTRGITGTFLVLPRFLMTLLVILLIALGIRILLKTFSRERVTPQVFENEDTKILREIHEGMDRMGKRIESLETILDDSGKKSKLE